MAKTRDEIRDDILAKFHANVLADSDIADLADGMTEQLGELLDVCVLSEEGPETTHEQKFCTYVLRDHFILFRAGDVLRVGGSRCDYVSYAASQALEGYVIGLDGSEAGQRILAEIRKGIDETALYPETMYSLHRKAGLVA